MKPPEHPVIYRRKYAKDDSEISAGDLRKAYRTAARMLTQYGEKYLPLFERLDNAVKDRKHKDELKARAKKIAQQPSKPRSP